MKISEATVTALAKTLCGDNQKAPYMSGPMLVEYFNELGFNDVYSYGGGFPTRRLFAAEKIRKLNGKAELHTCISGIVDPRRYIESDFQHEHVAEYLNQYLQHDGLEIVSSPPGYSVREVGAQAVDFKLPYKASTPEMEVFIDQQVEKCDRKLSERDYDGAITNARSFVESILLDIEQKASPEAPKKYDGDLPKLFKRVRKLMNMHENKYQELEPVLELLRGITSMVNGLASMSNKMGDRHPQERQPKKHHATLAVNAAKTLCEFMVSSYMHQFNNSM